MKRQRQMFGAAIAILVFGIIVIAQSKNAAPEGAQITDFTYQGHIKEGGVAPTGTYDFEFRLYAVDTAGAPIGSRQRLGVGVVNGVFSVKLDFVPGAFNSPSENRFLEIAVKPGGSPSGYQTLLPRQLITFAPYAMRSLNADEAAVATNSLQLGGVAAGQYVLTNDPRMTNSRDPLPGSDNYIQNRTNEQSSSHFNISGNGTVAGTLRGATVRTDTQFNIGVNRVLGAAGTENLFVGINSGPSNTGSENTFVGRGAGFDNTTGSRNAFVGKSAGNSNTVGNNNTAIGHGADVLPDPFFSLPPVYATAIGSGAVARGSSLVVLGRENGADRVVVPGTLSVSGNFEKLGAGPAFFYGEVELSQLGTPGGLPLCLNSNERIAYCPPSSLRYKTNVQNFAGGLSLVRRLQPITFSYKESGEHDIGFAAEAVSEIEPLLATHEKDGRIRGVKYAQITTILVNAIKEQQKQIESLKKLVCRSQPAEDVCK